MDLYASLMVTLVCLSTSFADCPDKCTCIKRREESFEGLHLTVRCTNLHQIPLELITSDVEILELKNNNITVLANIDQQVENITTLIVLDLSDNNITNLEVNSLRVFTNLSFLFLSHNNITNIPNRLFQTLPNLHLLYLSYNPYLILPENGFDAKALESLIIGHCNLKDIPLKFFDSMPNVKMLFLGGNHISYLGPHLITVFHKMSHVDLDDNKLTVFQPEISSLLKEHSLEMILQGNPFRCDCQFKDGLQQISPMTCVVPPGSNNNYDNVDQEVYLNSLDCDVSNSEAKTITTNTFTSVSSSDINRNITDNITCLCSCSVKV